MKLINWVLGGKGCSFMRREIDASRTGLNESGLMSDWCSHQLLKQKTVR